MCFSCKTWLAWTLMTRAGASPALAVATLAINRFYMLYCLRTQLSTHLYGVITMTASERTPQDTPGSKTTLEKLEELHHLKEAAMLSGGVRRIEAQHKKGKLTARER